MMSNTTWQGVAQDVLIGAAKGAATGSIVPGFGTALGAASGAVLSLAPELGKWLFGTNGAAVGEAARSAIQAATGTLDPVAQVAALADPAVASKLRVDLAQIAADQEAARDQAQQTRLDAALADIADARKQTVGLAGMGSRIAWGAPAVSLVATLGFFAAFAALILAPTVSDPGRAAMLNILVGALAAGYTGVLAYWIGSSAGSARKDDLLRESVPSSLFPKPAAVVPAADAR